MVGLGVTASVACKKHKLASIYEVSVYDIEDRPRVFYSSHETSQVYLTIEDAQKAAKIVANNIAFQRQSAALEKPDFNPEEKTLIVCVLGGRKVSKIGTIYGFGKIIYTISTQTKEVTDRFKIDPRFKNLYIDEYTEQPEVTSDMFYQWED